jgi:hypothetical protein
MSKSYVVYRHNSPSGKVYIGITSVSPYSRWRKGHGYIHGFCKLFSAAIKKYGWDNIKHEILLENQSESAAIYAEKYLIKWYKIHGISYNITDGGHLGGSLVGRNHPMYGRHEEHPMYGRKGKDNPKSIKVYQYTRDGVFVKAWDGISEAARSFNNEHAAATSIVQCCRYKMPSYGGYMWRYFYKEQIEDKAPAHVKPVFQYNIKGELINSFGQIKEVQDVLNISKNRLGIISACCNGKAVSGLGYFWSFIKYDQYPIGTVKKQVLTKMQKMLDKQKDDARLKEKQINVSKQKKQS